MKKVLIFVGGVALGFIWAAKGAQYALAERGYDLHAMLQEATTEYKNSVTSVRFAGFDDEEEP